MRLIQYLAVAATLFSVAPLSAETKVGFRQLGATKPVVVQRGKKTTVNIHSSYTLDGAHSVFFDKPGIQAKFLETKPIASPRRGRGRLGKPFRFEMDVPANQPLGLHEVRVATKQAVSSVTHILVTDFPVVAEQKTENGTQETAQDVPIPSAIAGVCEKAEDVDCYRISGTAGQEVTFQVYAQRVTQAVHSMQSGGGSYLMDAILTLYGPNRQVLAQNDNFIGGDAFIALKLPETGQYVLEVRDARYIGNDKYVYAVEISDSPYLHTVLPLGIQVGSTATVDLIGHCLKENNTASVTIADKEATGWTKRQIETSAGQTNPVSILISQHPQVMATAENHSVETALPLKLPVGINGRLAAPDQSHFFSFEAKLGAYYRFEVTSNQLGLPLDSVLEVYDAKGKRLAEMDDGLQTKDARYFFKAPTDGKFFISIRDLHDRGGDRFAYHLQAQPSGPDFELHGEYYYCQIAPGTRMIWFARIARLNGFTGPVEIDIEGLPAGVTLTPTSIPVGMTHCALILTAADDAKIGAALVRTIGKAKITGPDGTEAEIVRRGRVVCELQTQGGGQARWPVQTQLVGVTETLDLLKVEATPAEITLERGQQAEFKVRIERNKDFKEPVTLEMAFTYFKSQLGQQLPPGVKVKGSGQVRLAGKTLEGTITLEASDKAIAVDKLPIAAIARVPITFSITTNYASNPILLTIPPAK